MSTPAFNINLPVAAPSQPAYTPVQQPAAPGAPGFYYPQQPAATQPSSMSGSSLADTLAVGALAGYKAPRGIEHVRQLVGVNKFGQSVRRYSSGSRGGYGRGYNSGYGRGGSYGNSYSRGGSYGSSRYNSRSYRGYSNGGGRVGSRGGGMPFGLMAAVKSSVIWGGLISLATNGYQYFNKTETGAQAGSNVASDVVSSAVGGAGGAIASYAGAGMLAAMGMSGGLLTIAGIGIGIAGYFVADQLLRHTSIFQSFQQGVYKLLGGQ